MIREDTVRDIRKQCRLAMNGVASTSMREKGLNYKLNLGVSLNKIDEIGSRYAPQQDLAEYLWGEQTRELKLLALRLYPIEQFDQTTAHRWIRDVDNQEIREQFCLNILSKCSFAPLLIDAWIEDSDKGVRTSAYWLQAVMLKKKQPIPLDLKPCYWKDIIDETSSLRNACLSALKYIGRTSSDQALKIIDALKCFDESGDILKQEIYSSLKFEFEFYSK